MVHIQTFGHIPSLLFYLGRYFFSTLVSIALICEALGHSDLATTQIYLDNFDNEQIDEAMKNLL